MNLSLLHAPKATPAYCASQQLMDILHAHGFAELPAMGGQSMHPADRYISGRNYYFRNRGQCTINFLKDGRVHVLNGPIAVWNLHDQLNYHELNVLLAFASLCEEHQDCMRNFMGPRCLRYAEVLEQLPSFPVDWKTAFLMAMSNQ
ncbi:MAG: hypothetical protein ACKO7B_14035 [Flavobacteriales bacterium]